MQQLTGIDQLFLGLDTPTTNCIVGALTVFEAPQDGQPIPDEAFMVQRLTERLDYIPPLRMVLAKTPLGLDHDYLVNAQRVDLPGHMRTVRLPQPGTREQFASTLSRLMERPLDHSRPMWDLTIIEGLDTGGMAHLFRFSHGVVDGSLMTMVFDIVSDEPSSLPEPPKKSRVRKEPRLGKAEMLARGLVGVAKKPLRMMSLQVEGTKWVIKRFPQDGPWTMPALWARMIPGELGRPFTTALNLRQRARGRQPITPYFPTVMAPRTPINGHISARREFALCDLPLADFKTIQHGFDTTLNNAVVAVCAGAVRKYMLARGILPKRPMVVCVPVSLRDGTESEPWANYVHMINAPLPTHVADPLQRLQLVIDEMTLAKGSFEGMPVHLMRDSSRLSPRDGYGLMSRLQAAAPSALTFPMYNVTISNVRGPRQVNRLNGLAVAGYYPLSFLVPGGGLNISMWSYQQRMFFSLTGAPELVGDLWPLAEYLEGSLAELLDAVETKISNERVAAALSVETV